MARSPFQSVLETFEEVRFFISCRLSKRDNADLLVGFGMDDGNSQPFEQAQGYETLFAVMESIILVGHRGAVKDLRRVTEVEPVSLEIDSPLALVPSKLHRQSVYTPARGVKTATICWLRLPSAARLGSVVEQTGVNIDAVATREIGSSKIFD